MSNQKSDLTLISGAEFIKDWWAKLGMSGMITPTLSVEELDKKITDLRTVESWLNLNTNMLKSTIQALEVQRATIATLQSFNDTLNTTQKPSTSESTAAPPNAWWDFLQTQFKQSAQTTQTASSASDKKTQPKKTQKNNPA